MNGRCLRPFRITIQHTFWSSRFRSERNKTRKNEFLHVKCPEHINDFDHVLVYLYFYILYFSGSRRERKLLMSLFVKSSWWFSYKKASGRTFNGKLCEISAKNLSRFFSYPFKTESARENDKFRFDRWSESFIMIRCFSPPSLPHKPVIHLESFLREKHFSLLSRFFGGFMMFHLGIHH